MDKKNIDQFEVLRKLDTKSNYSQRKLASELGFSLGKLNYCMKALRKKGLVKINNFKNNPSKLNYVYILTPKGISKKRLLSIPVLSITRDPLLKCKKKKFIVIVLYDNRFNLYFLIKEWVFLREDDLSGILSI